MKQFIQNILYHLPTRRLRMLWRFVLIALLAIPIYALASVAVPAIALALHLPAGGLPSTPDGVNDILQEVYATSPLYSWLDIVFGLLALFGVLYLSGRFIERRKLADYGFHLGRAWGLDFGFGLLLGAVLMALIFTLELALGWVEIEALWHSPRGPFWLSWLGMLLQFISVGFVEEIWTRGLLLRNLAEGFNGPKIGKKWALLAAYALSSSIFGLLHLGNPNTTWVSTVNLMIAGLLLGLGFVLTGELALPIGLHISWNLFQGNVFGFPVSGMQFGATFIKVKQSGPVAWTGGDFGPEAGLVGLLAMLLGALLIVLWVRWRAGKAALHTGLSEYTA